MNNNQFFKWFYSNYPEIIKEMKKSDHNLGDNLNPYHSEGSVFTHSAMVAKVCELKGYSDDILIASWLHDIGKPLCREITDKGRVSFYNHDPVSAFLTINILNKLKLSDERKRHIFELVALHTQAYKLSPEKLAKLCTNNQRLADDLLKLAECDHLGRFIDEDRCNHTFEPYELTVDSRASEEKSKEVVVMVGLPGSGKSTYATDNFGDYFIASRDDLITASYPDLTYNQAFEKVNQKEIDKQFEQLLKSARKYDKVVIDKTHMSKKSRNRSLGQFGKDWKKTCIVLLPDLNVIDERNQARSGKFISDDVYERMIKSFFPPMYDVFDEIKYIWR